MEDIFAIQEVLMDVSWADAFEEGEKRIKKKLLDALIKTPSRDRSRLIAQREIVKRKISRALEENDSKKLRVAFRAQALMLSKLVEK